MQSQSKTYYVYRHSLAQALFASGYKGERVPNALYPDKTAWSFPLSPQLAWFIQKYYQDRELITPRFITEYLAAIDDPDGEGED